MLADEKGFGIYFPPVLPVKIDFSFSIFSTVDI